MASGDHRLWACVCTWSTWWGPVAQELPGSLRSPHVRVVCSLRCACREHLSQEALHNHFHSLLSLSLCAHPWFIATNQKQCALGQEPLCSQEPLQRARGPPRPSVHSPCPHHYPSGPYSPACTGLLQFLPPSPRCGDHLQERIREVCYSVSKGRPPNHNWTQADGSPAMRGPTLAWPAQQQLTGVGPCVTDQPESGCQAPRGGAQTDLTVGLELGAGDPHSAGGSS